MAECHKDFVDTKAFIVCLDCTGSMGVPIDTMCRLVRTLHGVLACFGVPIIIVAYGDYDRGDTLENVVKIYYSDVKLFGANPLPKNYFPIDVFFQMSKILNHCGSGGDAPEALKSALFCVQRVISLAGLGPGEVAVLIITDAPPHLDISVTGKDMQYAMKCAESGNNAAFEEAALKKLGAPSFVDIISQLSTQQACAVFTPFVFSDQAFGRHGEYLSAEVRRRVYSNAALYNVMLDSSLQDVVMMFLTQTCGLEVPAGVETPLSIVAGGQPLSICGVRMGRVPQKMALRLTVNPGEELVFITELRQLVLKNATLFAYIAAFCAQSYFACIAVVGGQWDEHSAFLQNLKSLGVAKKVITYFKDHKFIRVSLDKILPEGATCLVLPTTSKNRLLQQFNGTANLVASLNGVGPFDSESQRTVIRALQGMHLATVAPADESAWVRFDPLDPLGNAFVLLTTSDGMTAPESKGIPPLVVLLAEKNLKVAGVSDAVRKIVEDAGFMRYLGDNTCRLPPSFGNFHYVQALHQCGQHVLPPHRLDVLQNILNVIALGIAADLQTVTILPQSKTQQRKDSTSAKDVGKNALYMSVGFCSVLGKYVPLTLLIEVPRTKAQECLEFFELHLPRNDDHYLKARRALKTISPGANVHISTYANGMYWKQGAQQGQAESTTELDPCYHTACFFNNHVQSPLELFGKLSVAIVPRSEWHEGVQWHACSECNNFYCVLERVPTKPICFDCRKGPHGNRALQDTRSYRAIMPCCRRVVFCGSGCVDAHMFFRTLEQGSGCMFCQTEIVTSTLPIEKKIAPLSFLCDDSIIAAVAGHFGVHPDILRIMKQQLPTNSPYAAMTIPLPVPASANGGAPDQTVKVLHPIMLTLFPPKNPFVVLKPLTLLNGDTVPEATLRVVFENLDARNRFRCIMCMDDCLTSEGVRMCRTCLPICLGCVSRLDQQVNVPNGTEPGVHNGTCPACRVVFDVKLVKQAVRKCRQHAAGKCSRTPLLEQLPLEASPLVLYVTALTTINVEETARNPDFDLFACKVFKCSECGNSAHEQRVAACAAAAEDTAQQTNLLCAGCASLRPAVPSDTRKCPNCAAPIYRDDRCNHIECSMCEAHFCWLCAAPGKENFWSRDAGDVYNHLYDIHQGIYGTDADEENQ